MEDYRKNIKHLISVIQDKLENIKGCVNEYEFNEAFEELNALRLTVSDLDKKLYKCL